ncbi:nitrile hydratase subunit beta [Blastococcus sp. CT_GayMR19]|uniref:SH3-like domain-containing protein n=1 Tax=Blastococcus sp. CT_GayMR19 TaxID=2559608 RepID=UPI0010738069|nr:SH3-like domain-containing protein [Blastococcus sp. CT_GayMR19]TFV74896.1 nitrile hydratase subunit beta [Blastococcus sp. CT_GayMR19]
MPRFSNVGGVEGFGPIDTSDDQQPFDWVWQARVWALNNVVPPRFGHSTDEKRDLSEQLPARVHMEQGYYERWLTRLEILLVDDGVLAPGELDAAVASVEQQLAESGGNGGHREWNEESGGAQPWATRYE